MKHGNVEHELTALRRYYINKLPDKIEAIETTWKDYIEHPAQEKLQILYRQAHNMYGSAGTYGYKEISNIAKKIDKLLRGQKNIDPETKELISGLISQLRDKYKKINHRY